MVNKNSLKNLIPRKKGEPALPGAGRPPGPTLMTMLRNELQEDGKFKAESIGTFKKCIINGDARFWQMMIDMLEPEARSKVAAMMGVNVNVAQSQTQALVPQEYVLSRLTDAECLTFRDLARKCSAPPAGAGVLPAEVV
jgi:hypothetical protein